jgi:hypothetical protein
VPDTPKPKEEADELFHATLSDTQRSDPTATTLPSVTPDGQADDVSAKSDANRQRKRKRRRRTGGNQPST